jgi:hypothetical protein
MVSVPQAEMVALPGARGQINLGVKRRKPR